ncbi:NADH-quinone oxidoreductase subunit N [Buchnera aphidicola]|uniref:NADH-quinone oxidoreductase subunit N n=1 Tax=Buchnera aphidicola TaxID=9 RepID=UPI0031B849F9
MLISVKKIFSLSPFLILLLSIFSVFISIIVNRNCFFVFYITILFLISMISTLPLVCNVIPVYITSLLYIDFYSVIYIFLILFSTIFMLCVSYFYLKKYFFYQEEFFLLILCSIFGSMILVVSNHFFSVLIGMELMSVPFFGLMVYSISSNKISTMLKYIILSSFMTLLMLSGIVIIYLICGNLSFYSIKIFLLINNVCDRNILFLGLIFFLIPLFFKLSAFPFHFWMPNVYKHIDPILLIYSTTVMKISSFFVLLKIFSFFPYHQSHILYFLIKMMIILSIIFGSIMACFQDNIKKFFGYTSIVHMGYLLVTLLIVKKYNLSIFISFVYLMNYSMSNIGIFSILSVIKLMNPNFNYQFKDFYLYQSSILNKYFLNISMIIFILSFLSFPFTLGFIAKILVILIGMNKNFYFFNFIVLIQSAVSVCYYLKTICIYFNYKKRFLTKRGHVSYSLLEFFVFLISIVILVLGIFPQILFKIIQFNYI